jgi:RNA polymerase sigma-70 factor (family 1)
MPTYSLLNDSELTELLGSGDELAFTEIYNRYWKKLLAIANNHTKDQSASEEIVQEVFISLWNRKDLLHIQSINGYLAKAIRFAVFKQIQREKRHLEIKLNNYKAQQTEIEEDVIDAKFLQEYINQVVDQLPEKCRLVFKYSREFGMNIPEISKTMGIAEKTGESHLTKALKTIRLSLIKYGALIIILKYLFR